MRAAHSRSIIIGCSGCVIITAFSTYTALYINALPWPIVFAAMISLFFLKLLDDTSLNEVDATHTIMSSGAMVAGGLAFTLPGAWILGLADRMRWMQALLVAFSGTILELVYTVLIYHHFMVDTDLKFPTGEAVTETLKLSTPAERPDGSSSYQWAPQASTAFSATRWELSRRSLHHFRSPASPSVSIIRR